TTLLDVARRKADLIERLFGPGKRVGYPGHEEIELALVKLYEHTGEARYRDLAKHLIDIRGTKPLDDQKREYEYIQAHKPVREQADVVGHAVRAMYLYAGVTDIVALTGDADYLKTMETIWDKVVRQKMYITGGIGSRHQGEAFGAAYELPNRSAYCETCAAIGLALWNHRMLLLRGDGRFADVLERALYNGMLSGVSFSGEKFFYVNPLASDGTHHRQAWYGCACCPSNVVRFLPSIAGYVYAVSDAGVWVNLYIAGTATASVGETKVRLTQATDYPWSGAVRLTVEPAAETEFTLNLRIPDWADKHRIRVNGEAITGVKVVNGYAAVRGTWKPGDVVELELPMPIRRIEAHPSVADNRGRVALQRGPIVYCLEAVDNGGRALDLVLPREATLEEATAEGLPGQAVVIHADGLRVPPRDWTNQLYQPVVATERARITAVPYYAWDNREPGEMTVWIPEATGLAESLPAVPNKKP
ncbi:MAG: glycoside hydrolase family 127 protein, partial [Phycisphaerae bacterium]|nr:glycoside hydrolase family 127 protein [Phycisphaerae bacterium]